MTIGPVIQTASDTILLGYLGPGSGMGALGPMLALAGVMFLMVLGFVWYPVKVLMAKLRNRRTPDDSEEQADANG